MLSGTRRDEVAKILEQIAKEGLDHPRNLDAALDAISTAINAQPMMKCTTGEEVWYIPGDDPDEAVECFGDEVEVEYGYFVGSADE